MSLSDQELLDGELYSALLQCVEALKTTRAQWVHSVNAPVVLAALKAAGEVGFVADIEAILEALK